MFTDRFDEQSRILQNDKHGEACTHRKNVGDNSCEETVYIGKIPTELPLFYRLGDDDPFVWDFRAHETDFQYALSGTLLTISTEFRLIISIFTQDFLFNTWKKVCDVIQRRITWSQKVSGVSWSGELTR